MGLQPSFSSKDVEQDQARKDNKAHDEIEGPGLFIVRQANIHTIDRGYDRGDCENDRDRC